MSPTLIARIRTLAESHDRTGERRTAAILREAALALGEAKDTITALRQRVRSSITRRNV